MCLVILLHDVLVKVNFNKRMRKFTYEFAGLPDPNIFFNKVSISISI